MSCGASEVSESHGLVTGAGFLSEAQRKCLGHTCEIKISFVRVVCYSINWGIRTREEKSLV